jgi:excisionase family DNA binding protein
MQNKKLKSIHMSQENDHSTPNSSPNPYIAGTELCRYLGISRTTLWKMVKAGLPSYRVGRKRKFKYPEVDRYVAEQRGSLEPTSGENL